MADEKTTLELVTTNPADRFGHPILTLSAATIKAALKQKGITGKDAQQQVRDILRKNSGGASNSVADFVRDGGMLKSIRASQTKDGRNVLAVRLEQPKVSEIEALRAQLKEAIEKNLALTSGKK
jgi:hypothetical protein